MRGGFVLENCDSCLQRWSFDMSFGSRRSCCNYQEEIEKLLGQELNELKKTAKERERLWRLLIRCPDSKV